MIRVLHIPSGQYIKFWLKPSLENDTYNWYENITFWPASYDTSKTVEQCFDYFIRNVDEYSEHFFETNNIKKPDTGFLSSEFEVIYD